MNAVTYDALSPYLSAKSQVHLVVKHVEIYLNAGVLKNVTLIDLPGLPPADLSRWQGRASTEAVQRTLEERMHRERVTLHDISKAAAWIYLLPADAAPEELEDSLRGDLKRLGDKKTKSKGLVLITKAERDALHIYDKPYIVSRLNGVQIGQASEVLLATALYAPLAFPELRVADALDDENLVSSLEKWFCCLRGSPLFPDPSQGGFRGSLRCDWEVVSGSRTISSLADVSRMLLWQDRALQRPDH